MLGGLAWALPTPVDLDTELKRVTDLEGRMNAIEESANQQLQDGRIAATAAAARIESEVRPPWQEAIARVTRLRLVGHDDALRQKLLGYMRAKDELFELNAQGFREPGPSVQPAIRAKLEECARLNREFNDLMAKP
jgi:hypothetical protein